MGGSWQHGDSRPSEPTSVSCVRCVGRVDSTCCLRLARKAGGGDGFYPGYGGVPAARLRIVQVLHHPTSLGVWRG